MQGLDRQLQLKNNLESISSQVRDRATLIAVSKTFPASDVETLYNLGHRDFGENKVQDLIQKATELKETCPEIRWHFIGSLQTNKINQLLKTPNLVAIHSIDRMGLLEKVLNKTPSNKIGLFLQYNTSGEEEKSGFTSFDQLQSAYLKIQHPQFFFQGLMTMGAIRTENFEQDARACFSKLHEIATQLNAPKTDLSQGMSQDFLIALEIGTDFIRVGRAIFGNRVNIT